MMKYTKTAAALSLTSILGTLITGCTQQLPKSFALQPATETFGSNNLIDVNTKLDMLWVIDNSGSMDVSQEHLREGFATFAARYMKPTWDIRIAVITTDTYLANPAFANYLNSNVVGSGYNSPYINGNTQTFGSATVPGRTSAFVNPAGPAIFNSGNPRLTNGHTYRQEHPQWNANYAKLGTRNHDGPLTTLCWEGEDYFLKSKSKCWIRDAAGANTGPSHCAAPSASEDSMSQCVNTLMNDTVHSGKSIISTLPPAGTPADAAWTAQLTQDFLTNLSTGSTGSGRERGLASVMQFITDNEAAGSTTKFFRPGALRTIVFVSDEDDQSMIIPSTLPGGFDPSTYFVSCPSKTVDGYTYTVQGACPDPTKLIPTATYKAQLDSFFQSLDGSTSNPNYFTVPIVLMGGQAISDIHAQRRTESNYIGEGNGSVISDRGDRYIEFANLVGNGSVAMEFASTDYSPILDAVGRVIVQKKAVFQLQRAPASSEEMRVQVLHADGTATLITSANYSVSGKTLTITNDDIILALSATDKISIAYQPRSVN
ncbi:MAG: hypothetical protein H7222_03030 [Methylotenera sp.]|nr:hypothetical protein [Oligoflexia bacterium]